ncbi:uncharacterized protein IWZ02DRAFT_182539 [Phyllosticta citriasiana]|uniref:uncharacterized protein n=1 Tax=Phyllosticta citriasiana TaxID=595635 RepID=UPI0030FDA022
MDRQHRTVTHQPTPPLHHVDQYSTDKEAIANVAWTWRMGFQFVFSQFLCATSTFDLLSSASSSQLLSGWTFVVFNSPVCHFVYERFTAFVSLWRHCVFAPALKVFWSTLIILCALFRPWIFVLVSCQRGLARYCFSVESHFPPSSPPLLFSSKERTSARCALLLSASGGARKQASKKAHDGSARKHAHAKATAMEHSASLSSCEERRGSF